jgi:osmotically-inducible protein OsmY
MQPVLAIHDAVARRCRPPIVVVLLLATGLSVVGCGPSVGDSFEDASIVARVKTALLNDLEVGRRGIAVEASRGYVRLSGRVRSAAEIVKAVQIARGVPGVLDVTSLLQVAP